MIDMMFKVMSQGTIIYFFNHIQVQMLILEQKGEFKAYLKLIQHEIGKIHQEKNPDLERLAILNAKISSAYHFLKNEDESKEYATEVIELVEKMQNADPNCICEYA